MRFLIVCLLILVSMPAAAQDVFTLNAKTNCGTPISSIAVSRTLTAGTHTFTMSGAWSPFGSNGANGGNSWGTYVYVYFAETGQTLSYAAPGVWQATPTAPESVAAGVVFSFDLTTDSTVYFFNPDAQLNNTGSGICNDNRGSLTVTLDGLAIPVNEATLGTIKATYR